MPLEKTVTLSELVAEVNARRGLKHVGFGFFVRPELPTGDGKCFIGTSIAKTTKKQFLLTATDLLTNFEKRGAKITLSIPTSDYESFII